jgi:hypothetical protein
MLHVLSTNPVKLVARKPTATLFLWTGKYAWKLDTPQEKKKSSATPCKNVQRACLVSAAGSKTYKIKNVLNRSIKKARSVYEYIFLKTNAKMSYAI